MAAWQASVGGRAILAALLALPLGAGAAPAGPATLTREGLVYGPPQRLSGRYFVNFEHRTFMPCKSAARARWERLERQTMSCEPSACRDMDGRIAAQTKSEFGWGMFAVSFVGRITLARHKQRFRGDGERDVLVEKVVSMRLLPDR